MKSTTILLGTIFATSSVLAQGPGARLFKRADNTTKSADDNPYGLTDKQQEWVKSISYPECGQNCYGGNPEIESRVPLCIAYDADEKNPEPSEKDQANINSCLCLDRVFNAAIYDCYVDNCKDDPKALATIFSIDYIGCKLTANVTLPNPKELLWELCLDNTVGPTTLPEIEDLFDYDFAESIPPNTATTFYTEWILTQTEEPHEHATTHFFDRPEFTCTNTPTGLNAKPTGISTKTTGGSAQPTGGADNGNKTSEKEDDGKSAASGMGSAGVWAMGLISGVIGVLAVAL